MLHVLRVHGKVCLHCEHVLLQRRMHWKHLGFCFFLYKFCVFTKFVQKKKRLRQVLSRLFPFAVGFISNIISLTSDSTSVRNYRSCWRCTRWETSMHIIFSHIRHVQSRVVVRNFHTFKKNMTSWPSWSSVVEIIDESEIDWFFGEKQECVWISGVIKIIVNSRQSQYFVFCFLSSVFKLSITTVQHCNYI